MTDLPETLETAVKNSEIKADNDNINDDSGYLEWKDINVTINIRDKPCKPKKSKQILFGVSGHLKRGRLLAIMGGSGAGKSTLLNVISGRLITRGNKDVSGHLGYNQQRYKLGKTDSIKNMSAYVLQSDILSPISTVKEAFTFSAYLRLPPSVSNDKKDAQINAMINQLKLNKVSDSVIGNDAIRGVSGGEKKRVSVGVELITSPDLIFLDECTTGLDSFTALKTINILRELCDQGNQMVMLTIHQPSSEIFSMFDDICLLAEGHVVYFGPRNNSIEYFKNIGYECPKNDNPADYFINQIQMNSEYFIEKWKQHGYKTNDIQNYDTKLKPQQQKRGKLSTQIYYLLKREWKTILRDPRPSKLRIAQTIAFAIVSGALYFRLKHDQQGLRDRFGGIFFVSTNAVMSGVEATIAVFPEQRLLFEKERNTNMYSTSLYLFIKTIIQIPENLIFILIYCLITYWMIELDSQFYEVVITLYLGVSSVGGIGLIVGCFADSLEQASSLFPLVFVPLFLFSNFFVSLQQIPAWLRWISYINPFKYMIEGLTISEYKDVIYETEIGPNGPIGYDNGTEYLRSLNIDENNLYFDWIMLVVLYVGYRSLCWLILVLRNGW